VARSSLFSTEPGYIKQSPIPERFTPRYADLLDQHRLGVESQHHSEKPVEQATTTVRSDGQRCPRLQILDCEGLPTDRFAFVADPATDLHDSEAIRNALWEHLDGEALVNGRTRRPPWERSTVRRASSPRGQTPRSTIRMTLDVEVGPSIATSPPQLSPPKAL
jgi:hypothetical protein